MSGHLQCALTLDGLLFDFTRQDISSEDRDALAKLAETRQVSDWINRLFCGDHVNHTEKRAALHPALRGNDTDTFLLNGMDVMPDVLAVRDSMRTFCAAIHSGAIRGATGKKIRHVVSIGIGGSDLGPRMVLRALSRYQKMGIDVRFVANLDACDLFEAVSTVAADETLFIVASKTFSTAETLQNARSALGWLVQQTGLDSAEALAKHFVGVTANPAAAISFGMLPERIFRFWDWAGGRYSLWSAIGLPVALGIGMEHFEELLAGARAMDQHFRNTPLADNIPVQMGLIGHRNINERNAAGLSIVPYCHGLRLLPSYLQQLEMESNGKRVNAHGTPIAGMTAPIVFGDAGTNAQHAYFQMLHQGTRFIPTDFIAVATSDEPFGGHHDQLLANCFAQAAALATGREYPDAPHKTCPGGQPSSIILLPKLNPYYLGMLLALYEHKVYVQGVLWGINPFDQWGVELGKTLANEILLALRNSDSASPLDRATANLLSHIQRLREAPQVAG